MFLGAGRGASFGRAAERIGVSQGRVSQMIKRLE
ncbi:LysR family transcriptional regulator [Streptomyces sp. sk2.1]